jgi:RNA polymerase sigma factor (sigma-70 family)
MNLDVYLVVSVESQNVMSARAWGGERRSGMDIMDPYKTSLTLVEKLREEHNDNAWKRYDVLYRPMLLKFAIRLGLDQNDAEEAAQRTSIAVYTALRQGQYDRSKGKFRTWLLGIARHVIADLYAERARQPAPITGQAGAANVLAVLRDPDSSSTAWEDEWHAHLLAVCLRRAEQQFSSRDIRVFEMLAVQGIPVGQVAQQNQMSHSAVYQVKHRVLKFIANLKGSLDSGD